MTKATLFGLPSFFIYIIKAIPYTIFFEKATTKKGIYIIDLQKATLKNALTQLFLKKVRLKQGFT